MSPMPRIRPARRSGWNWSKSAIFSPVDGITGFGEHGHVDLLAQRAQLVDGGRPLEVGADQQRVAALLLEPAAELRRVRRLTGTLETRHQHDRRWLRRERDAHRLAAERV